MKPASKIIRRLVLFAICAFLLAGVFISSVFMQQGGAFIIKPSVVAGGGGASSNGNITVTGTIGQSILGNSSGGVFSVAGGFWASVSPSGGLPGAGIIVNATADTNVRDTALTLREAIMVSNGDLAFAALTVQEQSQVTGAPANPGLDTITFNLGAGPYTITLTAALPAITDPVMIDGATGNAGSPRVVIDGAGAGTSVNALTITAGNSTVRSLVVNHFASGSGILLSGAGGNVVKDCYLGADAAGMAAAPNGNGVTLDNSPNNIIGGTTAGTRNVISGNNGSGVNFSNVGSASTGNQVQGNYIGLAADGSTALGNTTGVSIPTGITNNTIGGATPSARNVISGNQTGVSISSGIAGGISGIIIQGNYIGVDATGTLDRGNSQHGIHVLGGTTNITIGGAAPGEGNVISGNNNYGILLASNGGSGAPASTTIRGNYIGVNAAGTAAIGNNFEGIRIDESPNNVIGGITSSARNVISGNQGNGILMVSLNGGTTGNQVLGNFIGTDVTGSVDLGNASAGIRIASAPNNIIGGTAAGAGNLISGNDEDGIRIDSPGSIISSGSVVQGNLIGTKADGATALGNTRFGVLANFAPSSMIGGVANGAANTIAFNGAAGVDVGSGSGVRIVGNSIFNNTGLAIDLIPFAGVTPNDGCDGDTGANNLQNFPAISSVSVSGANIVIEGTLESTASSTFTIDFYSSPACHPLGNGDGKTYLGSAMVTTGAGCIADFTGANHITLTPPAPVPLGQRITATATDSSGNTSEFSACSSPTAIDLISFGATGYDGGVMLEWQTGFEVNNLGFRIHRESGGSRTLLNPEPVAGSALVAGSVALTAGRTYAWWDNEITDCGSPNADCENAHYWLEDLDLNGASTWHGPYYVRQLGGKPPANTQDQAALLSSIGRRDIDTTRTVETSAELVRTSQSNRAQVSSMITKKNAASLDSRVSAAAVVQQTSLTQSRAAKISVKQAGWYRVTRAELVATGFDVKADPRMLRLFVDGKELPISVAGEDDGRFDASDAVEFYGLGLNTASTDRRVYWLVADSQKGLRIPEARVSTGYPSGASFACTVERRDRTIYFSALRNGDEENFFGSVVTGNPIDQRLTLKNISQTAREQAAIEVSLQGVTGVAHQVSITLNGSSIGRVLFNGQAKGQQRIEAPQSMLREGENIVTLQSVNGPSDVNLVDFIRVTYQHTYRAESDMLSVGAKSGETTTIGGFTSKDINVVDITDERDVQRLVVSIDQTKDGYAATVTAPAASAVGTIRGVAGERKLLALTGATARRASSIKLNEPSSWRDSSNAADFVIMTAGNLVPAIETLKKAREAEGYKVAVVDVEDLYDEFSFGNKAPESVRDFLSVARSSWKRAPRFVLFAGDASYDPKNYLGFGENDFVPTKLIDTAYLETASDDWFSDFDGDGVADIATGRLPVRSLEEAARAIVKVLRYQGSEQASSVLLVSDQNDGFDFEGSSTELRPLIPPGIRVEEIRRGQIDTGAAKARLFEAIARGQKIVNYAGHGSANQWRGGLLSSDDGRLLTNSDRLPLFVMMTCLNGYFQDAGGESLSEALMKAEGGAIAVWASTGLTLPQDQALMDQALYRSLFSTILKQPISLGEAIRFAKLAVSDMDVRRTWILLGDPTMRLR